ncbi:MAG: hypothetical protein G8D61_04760 [gamma proteobacterium symbiont of Ctena orbiculata]|nr:hypothetical protein [Candidatus Thiodiazotropha taylori]MBT3060034.1 hypothetical protein [Candidatus Thiodiazotropha sp. (ex Lucina pensylvanica)]MBV2093491.1 hypothetical protein [Candidatus Thiodiazotropha sp. (ex Codakia orbicularis)]PUB71875.1 MAG: hypothetical protein DBP03_19780 [gamma proteobacterium symbiont of Ctena orbiculata]MBT3062294.1 hypothetical protein [Candidatus Thiodiazotropha sp. (ex Lucina pensylvanica)]
MSLYERFYKRPFITFIILISSGLIFGVMTVNIFRLFAANWNFIVSYGLLALREGALRQTFELVLTGMLSMVFFMLFKFCERILIDRLCASKISFKRQHSGESK